MKVTFDSFTVGVGLFYSWEEALPIRKSGLYQPQLRPMPTAIEPYTNCNRGLLAMHWNVSYEA